jgi:hypothetical protein
VTADRVTAEGVTAERVTARARFRMHCMDSSQMLRTGVFETPASHPETGEGGRLPGTHSQKSCVRVEEEDTCVCVCLEEEDTCVCVCVTAHILKSQCPSKFPLN